MVQYLTAMNRCRRCYHRLVAPVLPPPAPRVPSRPNVAVGVRSWRRVRGLTQKQLAVGARLPRTYISRIENGRIIPGLVTLERVAEALSVNLPLLLVPAPAEGHHSGNGNGNGAAHANGNGNGNGLGAAVAAAGANGNGHHTQALDADPGLREILSYSSALTSAQRLQVLVRVREMAAPRLNFAH
jgi:DNA-binding XRE family transcriptional regulator